MTLPGDGRPADRAAIARLQIACEDTGLRQLSLFEEENRSLEKNHTVQETVLGIQKRFGKNSVLKGMNLKPAATMRERNGQIGGHKRGD